MVPTILKESATLSLNINEDENSLELELAKEIAEFCRLKNNAAKQIIDEVKEAVSGWSQIAEEIGISRAERKVMAAAFEQAGIFSAPQLPKGDFTYWISPSGKRHNSNCRYYKPESGRGRMGTATQGVACGICGG